MEGLENIVPHISSRHMEETIDFMVNVLDFKSVFHTDSYSELNSGHHLFGVLPSQDEPNEQSIYLRVKNIDALWASLEKKLGGIKAKGPFNAVYGMREVHIIIPATNTLLFIGSPC